MSTTDSILQLVRSKLENTRLSIQQQQKTLEACESRLKAMELEEQQCLARPIAAVEEEQQQAVNVRKMIEAYNEMVAKEEIECLGKKALQEMRTLKRHVSQIQKIEKTITGLQDIGNAVQMDNTALEAEPHIQKADLSKENISAIGDGREDILKATRLAAGEDDIQMATKNSDLTLPATNKNLFKPAKNGDLFSKKDATWHNVFKANMAGDGRKAAINEDPKGDAANNKDLLKPTKNRELNLKEDFPKDFKWHNIFKANMKEDSRRTDEDSSTATKGYQRLVSGKEDLYKSDLKNPATKKDLKLREDFPKDAKWHDIFKANMTGDSLKPVQRADEKIELAEPNPKDNESFDERNPEDLRRKVEEELLKASYYHKELRWLHDMEKMRSQIKEQNHRKIEQEKREFEEKEITQKESYKEIQPVGEEPTYKSSCSIDSIVTRSAFHRPPRCKEMAEMRAEIIRSWHETKAMVEAAIAEKDQCIREIDEIEASLAAKKQEIRESDEMEEERKKAVQVSYTISSFSSGESHACPHLTLVGQYSPSANEYLVDQSPATVQPSVHERAARWLSPVASNVDSSPGGWRQPTSNLAPESTEEVEEEEDEDEEEEEEEEEDMASYMSQFRANGQIFSHLLMVTHILDGHLRVRLGQNYNDAGLLEVKRDATQMFEERREPTGNCLRWRQLAGKMVFLMSRMLQQYYDLVDAQIARFA